MVGKTHTEIRFIIEVARRIGRGELVTCTPEERVEAMALLDTNRECWQILKGGRSNG